MSSELLVNSYFDRSEEMRDLIEEKNYWVNEARLWHDRAVELIFILRKISKARHLPSSIELLLKTKLSKFKMIPMSLGLDGSSCTNSLKLRQDKSKVPLESVFIKQSNEKKNKNKKAINQFMQCLTEFFRQYNSSITLDQLISQLPFAELYSGGLGTFLCELSGPFTDEYNQYKCENVDFEEIDAKLIQNYKDIASAVCISTYPFFIDSSKNIKEQAGSPNCDFYIIKIYSIGNVRSILCVTDGCGWGNRPRQASMTANSSFVYSIQQYAPSILNVQQAALVLMQAIYDAHKSIISGAKNAWEVGTTTLCGGIVVQVHENFKVDFGATYAFVSVNIGDCKAYYCTPRVSRRTTRESSRCSNNNNDKDDNNKGSKESLEFPRSELVRWNVSDLTMGNRNSDDVRETCGYLGPKSSEVNRSLLIPDLGNFSLQLTPCNKDDMIIIVSDGAYDNLDPEYLNIDPKFTGLDYDSWNGIPRNEKLRAKETYVARSIAHHLENSSTPDAAVSNILKWVRRVTHIKRSYMENNQQMQEPLDLPGKMDHTTIVALKID